MNTRPPIILRQRRDFGQTIGDTFAFMRQNWKPILKAIFTICIDVYKRQVDPSSTLDLSMPTC